MPASPRKPVRTSLPARAHSGVRGDGSRLYNDANESIGEVEDLAIELPRTAPAATSAVPMAVIQVGGFLGMGGRHVSVAFSELRSTAEQERIVMPNATRDSLRARPVYEHSTSRR